MNTNPTPASPSRVAQEQIAQRAYDLWLSRGCPQGCDVQIWLEAERELSPLSKIAVNPPPASVRDAQKGRVAISEKAMPESSTIDSEDLQDRLKRFGESPQRSPTSLDLS